MDYVEIIHVGTEVLAEVRAVKHLKPGESESLPPIIFKLNGEHYELDGRLKKLPKPT